MEPRNLNQVLAQACITLCLKMNSILLVCTLVVFFFLHCTSLHHCTSHVVQLKMAVCLVPIHKACRFAVGGVNNALILCVHIKDI